MRGKHFPIVVIFWLLFLCLPNPACSGHQYADLTILHLNDTHGFILPQIDKSVDMKTPVGGAAYLAFMIEEQRAANPKGTLLLSSGDMFQGTPISNVFRGKPILDIMNYLRFDAMALGNHEFDWGQKTLIDLASDAQFPFLSANLFGLNGRTPAWLKPYVILRRSGLRIAVIGITTPETSYTTKPDNVRGLIFTDPDGILPGLIRQVRKDADLIILLTHLGLDDDKALAAKVSGIDAIVGGHSHTAINKPVMVNNTIIVQAKCYGQYLGILKLKIDSASKKIISFNHRGILKKTLSGPDESFDPEVACMVDKYNDLIKGEFSKVIGETRTDLFRNPRGESNLGNLVCDAMREAAGSQIAFQNSGGIRANIPQGKITLEQVFTVLPFDNDIIGMDLTGEQIRAILEQNVSREYGILQVSGLKVVYDPNRSIGFRVVEAKVGDHILDPAKVYRVAINDFLASGGDRFNLFKQGRNVVYAGAVRDAFKDYLKAHSPVHPELEGRITYLNESN
jgi:2',3'-cyclic-nucleotide 2'-phosphodiesterase (5'-nucleotidase family)